MIAANVIDFSARKQLYAQSRVEEIISLVNMPFPDSIACEEGSGDLIAPASDWDYYVRAHRAFGVELPTDVLADAVVCSVLYLLGRLGSMVKIRAKDEALYEQLKRTRTLEELSCIDSIFEGTLAQTRELTQALRPLDKRPSDFA